MDDQEIIDPFEQIAQAWDDLKQAFMDSPVMRFMMWLANWIVNKLE